MGTYFRAIFQYALILLLSLGLFEILAQRFFPPPSPPWDINSRFIYLSKGALVNKPGFYNFAQERDIREIGYYSDATGKFTPEYDCIYRSDNLGFLDNTISYDQSDILIMGDSFTQGQVGCAWLPLLPKELTSRIYSTAIIGHGFLHWRNILSYLKKIHPLPPHIVIIFISQDLQRPPQEFSWQDLSCLNDENKCDGRHYFYPITGDLSAITEQRYRVRSSMIKKPQPASIDSNFWDSYFPTIHRMYLLAKERLLFQKANPNPQSQSYIDQSVAFLNQLSKERDITLIRVNTRDEAANFYIPDRDTIFALEELKNFKINTCYVNYQGFSQRDMHPNAEGYKQLAACVSGLLQTLH